MLLNGKLFSRAKCSLSRGLKLLLEEVWDDLIASRWQRAAEAPSTPWKKETTNPRLNRRTLQGITFRGAQPRWGWEYRCVCPEWNPKHLLKQTASLKDEALAKWFRIRKRTGWNMALRGDYFWVHLLIVNAHSRRSKTTGFKEPRGLCLEGLIPYTKKTLLSWSQNYLSEVTEWTIYKELWICVLGPLQLYFPHFHPSQQPLFSIPGSLWAWLLLKSWCRLVRCRWSQWEHCFSPWSMGMKTVESRPWGDKADMPSVCKYEAIRDTEHKTGTQRR